MAESVTRRGGNLDLPSLSPSWKLVDPLRWEKAVFLGGCGSAVGFVAMTPFQILNSIKYLCGGEPHNYYRQFWEEYTVRLMREVWSDH